MKTFIIRNSALRELRFARGTVLSVLVTLLLVLFLRTNCTAEFIPPDQVKTHTQPYTVEAVKLLPGTYKYTIGWQRIPVANAVITVERPTVDNRVHVEIRVKSNNAIDILYRLRHVSEGTFITSPFTPLAFTSRQLENRRAKHRFVEFRPDGSVHAREVKPGKPDEVYDFRPESFMLDPISSAFLARSLPVKIGSELAFDVFNGKHRFLIQFKVETIEDQKVGEKTIRAFKAVPRITKLTDTKGEKRFERAAIWVSADNDRQILRMESKVWIGSIIAKLDSFAPLSEPQTSTLGATPTRTNPPELFSPAEEKALEVPNAKEKSPAN